MKTRVLFLIALLTLIVLAGCKKDDNAIVPPDENGGGGGSSGTVSDSARMIVLDSLLSKINQLPGLDRDADNQAILQYVRTWPEIQASGIRPSGVWARFRDGRNWIYVDNFFGNDTSWPRPEPIIQKNPVPRTYSGGGENLPQNNGATIVNGFGSAFDYTSVGLLSFTDAVNDIRSWATNAGYSLTSVVPTVDGLKQVSGDGLFYLSGHGDTVDTYGNVIPYSVWTATAVSPANDLAYKTDLDSGRLHYMTGKNIKGGILSKDISETHYAFTHKFVRGYMNFGPRAVIFINACLSANDPAFMDAFFSKGAGLYLGWSNYAEPHRAIRAAHYYFDRALGGFNQARDATGARPVLSPPHKGYQLYDVSGYMYNAGFDVANTQRFGACRLLSEPAFADVTLLRPIIYSVNPTATDMVIVGWFGDDPGTGAATVKVGNTVVPIQSWAGATTIYTVPVQNGGDVVVSVRGRKSQPVPLTHFAGTFDYTLRSRGSLIKRVSLNIEFLADVRTNRIQVDDSPQWNFPRPIHAIRASGSYSAAGEYRDNQGNLVEVWTGGGALSLIQPGVSTEGAIVSGWIDRTGFIQSRIDVAVQGSYQSNGTTLSFSIELGVGTLLTQMNNSFVIPGATYNQTSGNDQATSGFSGFNPTFAPTNQTVR